MRILNHKKLLILVMIFGVSLGGFGRAPHQSQANEPIRIGVFLDLSGPLSSFGQATLTGVKMAAAEINNGGAIDGRPIELIIRDDLGRPDEAATVVTRLIDQNKVHALLGGISSSNSLAAAAVAQGLRVPMITPVGTHPAVTQAGKYIFRASFTDPFQGEALAEFAVKTLKAKRVALSLDRSSSYSKSLATAFENQLNRVGSQVIEIQSYTQGDRDFMAQLVAIKWRRPDVIFVPGYYTEAGMIAKQARQIRLNIPLLGGDGWDSRQLWDLGGTALNGSYIANHYASDSPSPANKDFVTKYKARYEGLEPDLPAALGYDALRILADAIRRAGTTDGQALQRALAETTNFAGVTGSITMDENRNVIKPVVVLRLQDGKFVYHKTVLPAEAATSVPGKARLNKRLKRNATLRRKSAP